MSEPKKRLRLQLHTEFSIQFKVKVSAVLPAMTTRVTAIDKSLMSISKRFYNLEVGSEINMKVAEIHVLLWICIGSF